ncbi:MAG: GFA family protein [Paracoccaceae bacterium]
MKITATCHCGAIEIQANLTSDLATAARCNCSFCRRRQAANVSARWEDLRVLKGQDTISCYSFGTHTAQHYFCPTCGIYTHHRRRSDPSQAGINLYCIKGILPADYEPLAWVNGINHPSDN